MDNQNYENPNSEEYIVGEEAPEGGGKSSGFKAGLTILILVIAALIIAAVVILTGNGSVFSQSDSADGLIINEVVSSNSLSLEDPVLGSPDWIELYNGTSSDIDLKDYVLSTTKSKQATYTFPEHTIRSGEYLVVFCTTANGSDDQLVTGFNISKSGADLSLANAGSAVISSVSVPALETDISWGLTDTGHYQYISEPTPGAKNNSGADQMAEYEESSLDLIINEVMPNNESSLADAEGNYYDWAEIYNKGSEEIDLNGWRLSDDPQNPQKWKMPEYVLKPGEYAVIYLSGRNTPEDPPQGSIYASFSLASDECSLTLTSPRGTTVDSIDWEAGISANISVGRDASGAIKYFAPGTPGAENTGESLESPKFTEQADKSVVISEILRDNRWSKRDKDGDRPAWVELHNISGAAVDLSSYALSDDKTDIYKWSLPATELPADGYLVVFLSGKNSREDELHTSFVLGNADKELVLSNISTLTTEIVTLPEGEYKNISYGRDASGEWKFFGQPTPGQPNTAEGFAELSAVEPINKNGVFINEVCAVTEARSQKPDWIELYNGGDSTVDLSGYYLSDSKSDPAKWQIPDGTSIGAHSYLVINAGDGGSSSAPFSISAAGETILLSDTNENTIDIIDSGSLRSGLSSGRAVGDYSGRRVFFGQPTKGEANSSNTYETYASEPVLSQSSGFYTEGFTLTAQAPEGAQIHYTTDGSKPTSSSQVFSGSMSISSTTVFRAVAISSGKLPSDTVTANYIFDKKHDIPVVLLCGDQSDINSVYASTTRSSSTERAVHFQYIEADGSLGVEFPAGIRVSGNSTRSYAQKSLNVYLRGGYGRSSVSYPFFEEYSGLKTFSSLTLRNSGQDTAVCKLRDAYASRIAINMNVDASATQFVAVYINGKYWGLYDLKENQNEDYLATHYGVDSDDVDMIRRNEKALSGSSSDFLEVRSIARSGKLSDDDELAEYCSRVDAIAFIDYIIAQNLFANSDMYNQKYWRSTDGKVRWRPILYDLDFAFRAGASRSNMTGSYFTAAGIPSPEGTRSNMDIPCGLRDNDKWVDEFLRRLAWYSKNTLSDETLLAAFDSMVEEMSSEIPRQKERFGGLSGWDSSISTMRRAISGRAETLLSQFTKFFGKSSSYVDDLLQKGQDPFWTEIEKKYGARTDITVK